MSPSITATISRSGGTSIPWAALRAGSLWAWRSPVSRYLDDGLTLEVNRLCTDGTRNACSFLYGAAARAAKAMGYRKIITYILDTEDGASLRAAGWSCAGLAGGKEWTGKRKPAEPLYPAQMKYRYEKMLNGR